MATKAVTVSADAMQAPSGQDAGGGQGMVGALVQAFNCLLRLIENRVLTAAAVAIATTTTQVRTTATAVFQISGVFKSKASTDNLWTNAILQAAAGFAAIPAGSSAMFLFLLDAAGVATAIQGPSAVGAAPAAVPADSIPEDRCVVGTCKVVCGTAGFTPGTTAWNAANITFTFADGYDAAFVGAYRINTRV